MQEQQYLNILENILKNGDFKDDRTGVGTLSLSGQKMEFDISEKIPILTTKKVLWDKVLIELLWFVSGSTNIDVLKKQNVHFWDANTSREFLNNRNLDHLREGDIGAGYGHQWRHFDAPYLGCDHDYTNEGIDQLKNVVHMLKNDPFSRRIFLSAWNPKQLHEMALPPCHLSFQCIVTEKNNEKYLDLILYQRSGDMFLGVPFNITSYSILAYMLCHLTGMKPRKFIHFIGDAHVYKNHIDAVKTQLLRTPYEFPTLKFKRQINDIDDFKIEDFEVNGYQHHPFIKAPMAK